MCKANELINLLGESLNKFKAALGNDWKENMIPGPDSASKAEIAHKKDSNVFFYYDKDSDELMGPEPIPSKYKKEIEAACKKAGVKCGLEFK